MLHFYHDGSQYVARPQDKNGNRSFPHGHMFGADPNDGPPAGPLSITTREIPDYREQSVRPDTDDYPNRSASHVAVKQPVSVSAMCFVDSSQDNMSLFVGYSNGVLDCVMVR